MGGITMKHTQNLRGILLAGVTGIAVLAAVLLRTFVPRFILPDYSAITVITLTLIALTLDCYLGKNAREPFWRLMLYAASVFGLFPWAAGFVSPLDAIRLAVIGAVVGLVIPFLFDTLLERLASGPVAKCAPPITAIGLFLAAQCLAGII